MLEGVLWLLRSCAPWRNMPECFGPWRTVYHRFRLWRNRGIFDQMIKRLHLKINDRRLIDRQNWMIDSTAVRATRASSGAGKNGLDEPADHALGRSRGGLTTKHQDSHALRRQWRALALSPFWRSSQRYQLRAAIAG